MKKEFNKSEYNKMCLQMLDYESVSKYDKDFDFYEHALTKELIEANTCMYFIEDWNWIMGVVDTIPQKVQGINVSIHPNSCLITDTGVRGKYSLNSSKNIVLITDAQNRKDAVVQALWEFLNYYNEQKQQPMKAEELRIGNWVKGENGPYQIKGEHLDEDNFPTIQTCEITKLDETK